MKIGIANDHGGYKTKKELAKKLEEKGYTVVDFGSMSEERVDFPEYAFKICHSVISNEVDLGITICKTGIGMSIACNKVKGIRCAKIDNKKDAEFSKRHNNANVLAFSGDKKVKEIIKLIEIFNSNEFEKGRYQERNDMILEYENEH